MSFVRPSTSTFPFPGQHADDPNGPSPHANGGANGENSPQDLPGGRTGIGDGNDTDAAENRGQLGGDDDGASGPGRSGHGVHDGNGNDHGNGNGNGIGNGNGNGNGNGGPENNGPGQQTLPGQTPGLPGGRTGDPGNNAYGNGNGNGNGNAYGNGYGNGNGGASHGGGIYAGGAQTPNQGGLGGIIGGVSQTVSSITAAVFGSSVPNALPNTAPNLFTEHMPRFVGDSATQTQPSNDHGSSSQPAPPSPQRASNDTTALPPRNADPTPQPPANPAGGRPEAEGRGVLAQAQAQMQSGIDARTAQMLAQGGTPLMPMEHAPETPVQMAGLLAATASEAEALERALTDSQNKAQPQRTDGKDMAAQLRQGAGPEGDVNTPQQTAQSRQQTDALDRLLAKMQPDARTAPDARAADGRQPDARAADGRLVPTDGRLVQADGTLRSATDTSRQGGDLAKTAAGTTEGGRLPVGADGRSAQSSFGRGLFGGAAEYTRQALDWVGQQVREFGFGASPDADGARAMRVVAGLVVASVGILVVIGVLYALRIIFVI
jgi:hypothetical protein